MNELFGYPTTRGVDLYAAEFGMNRSKFLKKLQNVNLVLDVSSGGGLLEKEVEILKRRGEFASDVEVVSLDLAYGTKEGKNFADYSTHMVFTNLDEKPSREKVFKINEEFKKTAVGASYTNIPFAEESFDLIFASHAFGVHVNDRSQLMKAYSEIGRILAKGGEAYISIGYIPDRNLLRSTLGNGEPIYYGLDDLPIGLNARLERASYKDKQTGQLIDHDFLVLKKE